MQHESPMLRSNRCHHNHCRGTAWHHCESVGGKEADLLWFQVSSLLVVHMPRDLEALGGPRIELLQRELQWNLHGARRPLLAAPKAATEARLSK